MESSFQWNSKTKVEFLKKLPSEARLAEALGFKPEKILVVYDKTLVKDDTVKKWLKDFPLNYAVSSGERLKDAYSFTGHLQKIFKLITPFSNRGLCVVGLGGGSVGDFTGFLSSVLKRGVPLVHIPSTLLAAMDSAHGGKTALNVGEFKNQVGTFYPADAVLIVKGLFEGLPGLQVQSASGELVKMALLEGGKLFTRFLDEFKLDLESIWNLLPAVIEAKYKVVAKDPFEKSGERQILNFGHSLGHALESYYGLAHGIAVGQGLMFALQWSEHQGYFRGSEPFEIVEVLHERVGLLKPKDFARKHKPMSRAKLSKLVIEDKKLTDTRHMNFIFLEKIGVPFRKVVTVDALLTETQRQGWTSL
jgi:3-dehydroquinate synthase